jgi:hypothetical protein
MSGRGSRHNRVETVFERRTSAAGMPFFLSWRYNSGIIAGGSPETCSLAGFTL